MCGREVLLLKGLDQVGAVLRINTPQRTFSIGLEERTPQSNTYVQIITKKNLRPLLALSPKVLIMKHSKTIKLIVYVRLY